MKISMEQVLLYHVTAEVTAELTHKSIEKNIDLCLEGNEGIVIDSNRTTLGMLLRNIIDNAINYTPEGGTVTITVAGDPQQPCVRVIDTGPGIPDDMRDKVFQRFYRINVSNKPGCGLGMAIARQCADLLHAHITLTTPESGIGLQVEILFQSQHA